MVRLLIHTEKFPAAVSMIVTLQSNLRSIKHRWQAHSYIEGLSIDAWYAAASACFEFFKFVSVLLGLQEVCISKLLLDT